AGLKNAFIPARAEVVSLSPLTIIDGAHNPDGANSLLQILKEYSGCTAIIGVMKDKNYKAVLSKTLPFCKNVICVKPNVLRALSTEELSSIAQKYCDNVFTTDTLDAAITIAKEKGQPIFAFGSLYLASEIRSLLKVK
ncbi:MAG: glutamate ligase domain-containing protein, partial [Acutalibacteraceae bacterium]